MRLGFVLSYCSEEVILKVTKISASVNANRRARLTNQRAVRLSSEWRQSNTTLDLEQHHGEETRAEMDSIFTIFSR